VSYQPQKLEGLRVPLFDRLVDTAPHAPNLPPSPVRMQQRAALFASMARDISRLLNTRRGSGTVLNPATATVLEYGIPSFSHLSAASATDRRLFTETIRAAVSFFEPRAREVAVTLEPDPDRPAALLGYLHCKTRLGQYLEPVSFPLVVRGREGTVEVLAPESNAQSTLIATAITDKDNHG
jgi:type VI secretion system protein ImpF